ncbi:hypothetical protein BH23VER1_BH23VER1_22590 [soil metagenome]
MRKYASMRTTVVIPDPLLKQAKIHAVEHSTTLRALVIEGLEHVLAKSPAHTTSTTRPTTPPEPAAVKSTHADAGAGTADDHHRSAASDTDIHRLLDS